jgi:hypothetical protein
MYGRTMSEPDSERDPWRRAVTGLDALWDARLALESDFPATLERLRRELHSSDRLTALYILRIMEHEYTVALMNDLVEVSLSESAMFRVWETLGRLSHTDLERLVPAAVRQVLEEEDDVDAYQRLAGLLSHLGLTDALRELCQRALASDAPETQAVGEEYLPQPGEAAGPS